jgi:hypothetical protein
MLVYFLLFLLAAFLYFNNGNNNKTTKAYWFFMLCFVCLVGFRDMMGGFDVYIYGEVFEAKKEMILIYKSFETGFKTYFLFLKIFNNDRYFMFFVTALITIFVHFQIVKKYSPILFFSLYILFCKFCLMYFVYLRQTMAMCVAWIAIRFIIKRQLLYYLIFIFIATTFHKSALLFLPIYFIYNRKFSDFNILLISVLALVISLSPFSKILFEGLSDVANEEKLNVYLDEDRFNFNIFYFIEVILIIGLMLKFKADFYKDKMSQFIFNGMFVYVLVSLLALKNATFVRFGWYFYLFVIIGLAHIYNYIDQQKNKSMYKMLVFLYFGFLFFRLLIVLDGGDYMNYKAFFQNFNRNGLWDYREYRNR